MPLLETFSQGIFRNVVTSIYLLIKECSLDHVIRPHIIWGMFVIRGLSESGFFSVLHLEVCVEAAQRDQYLGAGRGDGVQVFAGCLRTSMGFWRVVVNCNPLFGMLLTTRTL